MTDTTTQRLRDLEAEAFRTGRTLADHGEQLRAIDEKQTTAFGNIDSLADAIGAPGDRTIAQRLDKIERALDDHDQRFDSIDSKLDEILGHFRNK